MTIGETIVLITGANQGLGFETAKTLLSSSDSYLILIGTRDPPKGVEAVNALKLLDTKSSVASVQIDVAEDESVDAAARHVEDEYGRLDVLVNNAGIFSHDPQAAPRDTFRKVLGVNAVGAQSVTEAFLPLLRKSSTPRLVFVGSSTGSMTHALDPQSPLHVAQGFEYRASKAALNMLMVLYHLKLKDEGFKVLVADPGLNATNLGGDPEALRKRGAVEPHVGGERIATVIRGDRDADVGRVCGEYGVCPW